MRGPYELRIPALGADFDAADCANERSDDREYNAGMLYKSACNVAARLSRELGTEVTVIGSTGSGRAKVRVEAATFGYGRR